MFPFRVLRSGTLLAGMLAAFCPALPAAEGGFTTTLSAREKGEAGLTALSAAELTALDALVAEDLARARQPDTAALPGTLAERHPDDRAHAAGLDRLTPAQLARLDELIAASVYTRPTPKTRPRLGLKDSEVLSEQGRLRVHGGMSVTVGGGSGRSFHGSSAWVSYYDPVTGIGLGFSFSHYSGDGLYGSYPGYYSVYPAYTTLPASYYSATPRTTFAALNRMEAAPVRVFNGDGASLRGPVRHGRDDPR